MASNFTTVSLGQKSEQITEVVVLTVTQRNDLTLIAKAFLYRH